MNRRPPPPTRRTGVPRPPAWATGAPMHSALPRSPAVDVPAGRGGRPPGGTTYPSAFGAAAVWAVGNLALVLALAGPPPSLAALGRLVGALVLATALAAVPAWAISRRRTTSLLALALLALPVFAAIRLITNL